ncbi:MAG: hypothetical protein SOT71_08240 [Romboutsia timonensis]|nr:hypothetical protein [Romboutsia timonensis]MDY2882628.1 hypothetical protein [Romboutsia timonensis]
MIVPKALSILIMPVEVLKLLDKKTKNLCKMIDKDNLYNVLFN